MTGGSATSVSTASDFPNAKQAHARAAQTRNASVPILVRQALSPKLSIGQPLSQVRRLRTRQACLPALTLTALKSYYDAAMPYLQHLLCAKAVGYALCMWNRTVGDVNCHERLNVLQLVVPLSCDFICPTVCTSEATAFVMFSLSPLSLSPSL